MLGNSLTEKKIKATVKPSQRFLQAKWKKNNKNLFFGGKKGYTYRKDWKRCIAQNINSTSGWSNNQLFLLFIFSKFLENVIKCIMLSTIQKEKCTCLAILLTNFEGIHTNEIVKNVLVYSYISRKLRIKNCLS